MTGRPSADDRMNGSAKRVATVKTIHADAKVVAAALAPDHTDSMDADVDGDTITCTIDRPTTGGLRSTVDDYVVNLRVADRIVDCVKAVTNADSNTSTVPEDGKTDLEDGANDADDADDATTIATNTIHRSGFDSNTSNNT